MKSPRTRTIVYLAIPVLTAGILLLDLFTPRGVNDWVLYCIPLLLSVYGRRYLPFLLAAVFSVLTAAGFYWSPPAMDAHWHWINLAIGIGMLWVVAILVSRHQRTLGDLRQKSQAVEQSPDSVVTTDLAGHITYVNPKFCAVTGYSPAEVLGKNPRFLQSGELPAEIYQQLWQTITAGQEWHGELHNRKKNGELFWEAASIGPVLDEGGEITQYLAVKEDITRRKQAEEKLLQVMAAVESASDAIGICDLQGRHFYQNKAYTELFGYATAEELQAAGGVVATVCDPAVGKELFDTILAGQSWAVELKLVTKSGRVFDAYERADVIKDQDGKIIGLIGVITDITGRKMAEAELRHRGQQLQMLAQATQEINAVLEIPVILRQLVATAMKLTGATEGTAGLMVAGRMVFTEYNQAGNLRPIDYRFDSGYGVPGWIMQTRAPYRSADAAHDPHVIPEIQQALGFHNLADVPIISRTGELLGCFELHNKAAGPFDDGDETVLLGLAASAAIALDNARLLAEQRQAEESLRASEERFRRAVVDSPFPIMLHAEDGAVLQVSQSWCDITGYSPAELATIADWTERAYGERKPQVRAEIDALYGLDHRKYEGDYPIRLKNGATRIWEFSSAPLGRLPDGRRLAISMAMDVTERRSVENSLRESHAFNESLLATIPFPIDIVDEQGHLLFLNAAMEQAVGKSALGRHCWEIYRDDRQQCPGCPLKQPVAVGETKVMESAGVLNGRIVEITHTGMRYQEQKAILEIFNDITEKKKLASQMLRSQRMESIGNLAGGIAHDLNNALAPLLISIELLKDGVTDAEKLELLHSFESNVQRIASLVKQVLMFGRGVAGERISIQPARLAREMEQIIRETFPKSVEFEYQIAPDLWPVTGDTTQLHQVLLNLCINARDAMPNGGKLSLKLENVVLDEQYANLNLEAKPGPYVVLQVVDTGTGMPPEIRDRIFEPFFTTKEFGQGTGLGLSTTLGIIKSHGGFINCYSEVGQGSTFKVYLPAKVTPQAAEAQAVGQTGLPRGHGELVLVVDDEEAIRAVAKKTLEQFGYRVLCAANGAEALSIYAARREEIAVVITDMSMPVMDGPATIVALKTMNPQVKIIGSSGLAANGNVAKAVDAEVKHFIPKPYTLAAMLNVLAELLAGT